MTPEARIVYKDQDGNVSIVIPTPEFLANGGTRGVFLASSVPDGAVFEELHSDDIPTDRYFRNAWRLNGKAFDIDRAKAEVIHLNNLRKIRDEKLKAQDIEYQKALEFRDDAAMNRIAGQKKRLRDMPTETDFSGMTLEEVKAFVPDILK